MYGQSFSSSVARREALAVAALAAATPTRYATLAECRAAHEALEHGTLGQRALARARLNADLRQIAADEPLWQASMDDYTRDTRAEDDYASEVQREYEAAIWRGVDASDEAEARAARQRAAASDTSRWF